MTRPYPLLALLSVPALLLLSAGQASAAGEPAHTPSQGVNWLPEHRFQWAPSDAKRVQVGVNFGLLQLALGGANVAAELRYRRLWLEYSHGMHLDLNSMNGFGLTGTERDQNLRLHVPTTTGFGVGVTLADELWLGVEFKLHQYRVNAPEGPVTSYQTYSIGPVLGYKAFLYKGLYADFYARYWPNVASSLDDGTLMLQGNAGSVSHSAHAFNAFGNVSIGYAIDL